MEIYPSRKARSRKELYKKKKRLIYLLQVFTLYIGLINLSFVTGSTVSYFNDQENISGTVSNMENFCEDKDYKKKYKDACKDNSGIGNGCEEVDMKEEECSEEKYDPDNPKHGDNDDHPKKGNPKNKVNGPTDQESSIEPNTAEVEESKDNHEKVPGEEVIAEEDSSSGEDEEKEETPAEDASTSKEPQSDAQKETESKPDAQQSDGNSASDTSSADIEDSTSNKNSINESSQE